MLSQRFALNDLRGMLAARADWRPYPTLQERAAWENLPEGPVRVLAEAGTSRLNYAWPALPATLFLDFARTGRRTPYRMPYYDRRYALADLVLAECLEGQGRYLDDIVNGVWAICEETYWGVPAHVWVQRAGNTLPDKYEPTVDLFAAETGALLAWTHYLLGDALDAVSPVVRPRLEGEIRARILDVNRRRIDFPWQGRLGGRRVNNWNPWICSNWLTCLLAIEDDAQRRAEDAYRLLRTLDYFIDPHPQDGGCDEGPNYWGRAAAALYENLELLYGATDGQLDVFDEDVIRRMGQFIYRAHIAGDYYLNFADASAVVMPEALLTYNYGQRIGDAALQSFGLWLADRQRLLTQGLNDGSDVRKPSSLGRALAGLFTLRALEDVAGAPPLMADVWLPQTEVACARDAAGSAQGFYAAIKGGHNDESHNHNDVGAFVVYLDGRPLLVDAGVEEYTAQTFGPQRYDIWTMQSAFHNLLPVIGRAQQRPGAQCKARRMQWNAEGAVARAELDIAAAYGPEAGVRTWVRAFVLERGVEVRIRDVYQLERVPDAIVFSVLTPCAVTLAPETGAVRLARAAFGAGRQSAAGAVHYDARQLDATVETIAIQDERMGAVWGDSLRRVVFTCAQPEAEGEFQFTVRADRSAAA